MAKRFIDTGLFDDEWFSELSCDAKIFWLYYLTKCDHAGLLKYNKKLIEFQCGFKDLEKVLHQFPNRIVRVSEQLLFCPKFIDFQYPGFPDCKFKAAISAKDILIKNNIDPNTYQTVSKDLHKSYSNGNSNSNGNGNGISNSNSKTGKPKKNDHLFSESPFFDLETFKSQFTDTQYEHANFAYYHEVISNWSASNGNRKKDWIATAKNWMASDMTKGKFIDNKFNPNNGNTKTQQTRVSHITDEQLHEAFAKRFGSR